MLTIFTTCRSFQIEEFAIIQRNALTSWSLLNPKPEIFVMGIEPGVAEICQELGFIHIKEIEYTEYGTPLLNSMIEIAELKAKYDNMLLISSDVIIFQSMATALKVLIEKFQKRFCGVARKLQQPKIELLDFLSPNWQEEVKKNVDYSLITSGDFFLYPKGFWGKVPEFVIGRAHCDNWLFYEAAIKNCLVDMTGVVEIVDFIHTYSHLPKGWMKEKMQNVIVSEGKHADFLNANWKMTTDFELIANKFD